MSEDVAAELANVSAWEVAHGTVLSLNQRGDFAIGTDVSGNFLLSTVVGLPPPVAVIRRGFPADRLEIGGFPHFAEGQLVLLAATDSGNWTRTRTNAVQCGTNRQSNFLVAYSAPGGYWVLPCGISNTAHR